MVTPSDAAASTAPGMREPAASWSRTRLQATRRLEVAADSRAVPQAPSLHLPRAARHFFEPSTRHSRGKGFRADERGQNAQRASKPMLHRTSFIVWFHCLRGARASKVTPRELALVCRPRLDRIGALPRAADPGPRGLARRGIPTAHPKDLGDRLRSTSSQ
jgi:hypothetical protein